MLLRAVRVVVCPFLVACATSADHAPEPTDDGVTPSPRRCASLPPARVIDLAATQHSSIALLEDGSVWCWGWCLPSDADRGTRLVPRRLDGVEGAQQISGGAAAACATLDDGTIRCWGDPLVAIGELRPQLIAEPALDSVSEVSVGTEFACALKRGGQLWCWGRAFAFKGVGSTGIETSPYRLEAVPVFDEIEMGPWQTCAHVDPSSEQFGPWWCWGQSNLDDSLADLSPQPLPAPAATIDFSAGDAGDCAVMRNGGVQCWCGSGHQPCFDGLTDVRRIDLGHGQMGCVVDREGKVACRHLTDLDPSAPIDGVMGTRVLATGDSHACAVDDQNSVRCWGRNPHGQLGDGTIEAPPSDSPWPDAKPLLPATCVQWAD
jgi:alpha-tubulin suppressor-like RCC1 family protein